MALTRTQTVNQIGRGTTPTIFFSFSIISVSDVAAAYLTIKQGGATIYEGDLAAATVDADNNRLGWTLTQTDTLAMNGAGMVSVQCRWRLNDGTAGESKIYTASAGQILKEGVI